MPLFPISPIDSDPEEPDRQLRVGLECIQEAYDRKVAVLLNELTRWKNVADEQKQKISALEADVSTLKGRIVNLEAGQGGEAESLRSSNASLSNQLDKMRKYTLELETFRKSIVNTVDSTAKSLQLPNATESMEKIMEMMMAPGMDTTGMMHGTPTCKETAKPAADSILVEEDRIMTVTPVKKKHSIAKTTVTRTSSTRRRPYTDQEWEAFFRKNPHLLRLGEPEVSSCKVAEEFVKKRKARAFSGLVLKRVRDELLKK